MLKRIFFSSLVLFLLLTGCSTVQKVMPGKPVDYKKAKSEPRLEVPPDLSSNAIEDTMVVPSATYSEYQDINQGRAATGAGGQVLTQPQGVRLEQDGSQRWLVVDAAPEVVWNRVTDFWLSNGFLLTLQDPKIGIMETDWAENRAEIDQGYIRNMLKKSLDLLYSASTRDKFRVRLERGDHPGSTEIFLTHRGLEETLIGEGKEDIAWVPRPRDPELETEMLKRLMVYLGAAEQQAQHAVAEKKTVKPRASLIKSSAGNYLELEEDFSRSWRRLGLALDQVGFTVEDRDRSQGVYYVRYIDPLKDQPKKGWLSKLAFWSDDEVQDGGRYQIQLKAQGATTRVSVLGAEGQPDNSTTAVRILTSLQEQLR